MIWTTNGSRNNVAKQEVSVEGRDGQTIAATESETNDHIAAALRALGGTEFVKPSSRFTLERGGVELPRCITRTLGLPLRRRLCLQRGDRGVDAWALAVELYGCNCRHSGTSNLDVWHNWLFAPS